jgi:hypothetical protein
LGIWKYGGYSIRMKMRRKLKDGQLLGPHLEGKTLNHPVLIEEHDKAIHFLLFPSVLKNKHFGKIGLFDSEGRRVLAKIRIDKDVPVILPLNPSRRSKNLKNFTLGGGTDFDLFIRIVSDLGAHVDPSDAATTRQDHQERDEDKSLVRIRQSLYESHNILSFHRHR